MAELAKVDDGVDEGEARALQEDLDELNEREPVDHVVPFFVANFRHPCDAARQSKQLAGKGVSTAIDMKERYVLSESERTALVYREGSCKRCGQTARSERGRAVDPAKRPPVSGRVGRA